MKFKIVLFDAGDVLFQANTAVSDALGKKFNIPENDLLDLWKGEYKDLSRGVYTTEEFLDIFARKYDIPRESVKLEDFINPYIETLVVIPGMENLIKELSKKKVKLALLSDTSEMFHLNRNELKLFKFFDKQFLSFEIGHMKPDKRTFQAVIDHYGFKPGEIFFIDDNPTNIEAAKKVGMKGVVFKTTRQLTKVLRDNQIL